MDYMNLDAEKRFATPSTTPNGATGITPNSVVQPTSTPLLVKDVLSKELQLYYEKITEALLSGNEGIRDVALSSIASDPGLQALLPYFVKFSQEKVTKNLKNLKMLATMVSFLDHILRNPNFFLEPYVRFTTIRVWSVL
jgi:transcription initiation factor TFIID subunit 6